jgi:IS4 transposase
MVFLTNLPTTIASDQMVAELYRNRWQVEELFLSVTMNFRG